MGIIDYSVKPRSDGYRGIRVYLKIEGKLKQKYFPSGHMVEAEEYEHELLNRYPRTPRHKQEYQYKSKKYDPPKRTGIVGITMQFQEQKRCVPVKYYPGFAVTYQNMSSGTKYNSSRALTRTRDLQQTWNESCRLLTMFRGGKRVPNGWYGKCPSDYDFEMLRQWYNRNGGRDISKSTMKIFFGVRA